MHATEILVSGECRRRWSSAVILCNLLREKLSSKPQYLRLRWGIRAERDKLAIDPKIVIVAELS
jgi:hypothetical protein